MTTEPEMDAEFVARREKFRRDRPLRGLLYAAGAVTCYFLIAHTPAPVLGWMLGSILFITLMVDVWVSIWWSRRRVS